MKIEVPPEVAVQYARMAECAMLTGEKEKAISAIEQAFEAAEDLDLNRVTLDSFIDEVASVRITTILNGHGIRKVSQLVAYTPQELVSLSQIRWKSVEILQRGLEKHGLSLIQR